MVICATPSRPGGRTSRPRSPGPRPRRLQWRVTQAVGRRLQGRDPAAELPARDRSAVNARLRGAQRLPPAEFWRWVDALGLDADELLTGALSENLGREWTGSRARPPTAGQPRLQVDWPAAATAVAGNVPPDADGLRLLDDETLAWLVASAVGLPLSRFRRERTHRLGAHMVVAHGSTTTILLPVALGPHEDLAERWPEVLARTYGRLVAAASLHVDEVVAALLLGPRMLDQTRGWDPGLHGVRQGALSRLSQDEFRRLDSVPGSSTGLSLSVVAAQAMTGGTRLLITRPSAAHEDEPDPTA